MNPKQSKEIFEGKNLPITTYIDAVDSYRSLIFQYSYAKNVGIRGLPGRGKTCCMMYCILYTI